MKLTKYIKNALVALLVATAITSCITEDSVPNKEREKISLEAWIKLNKPGLLNNYQENGGYYVEVLDRGVADSLSLMSRDTCWVYTEMTGRDINGSVCMTRSGTLAEMCGTFSYFTHYVPYVNYCGNVNMGLLEGTYLAMRNELKVGDETIALRKGTKVRLYLPSSIAYGESGSNVQGGYEGQYGLDASRPLILDIEVLRSITNPSEKELEMVDDYIKGTSDWHQAQKPESENKDNESDLSLKGLYYSYKFNPATDIATNYKYIQPHLDGTNNPYRDTKKYTDMADINAKINNILLERFGEGITLTADHIKDDKYGTQVTEGGRARVWYVLRFLDGFVVDTNIAEIRTLVYGEKDPVCEVFSYSPADDKDKEEDKRQAIGAWYYCIPNMHHGAYGQIITTSGYAYGAAGISGTTTTETSSSTSSVASYYNAMNYYNYYNSYYNYYSPYYNYYDYNYYGYNYGYDYGTDDEVTTRTTISTEILPYTPLIFTLYVEPLD